jgi:hypothetical protein
MTSFDIWHQHDTDICEYIKKNIFLSYYFGEVLVTYLSDTYKLTFISHINLIHVTCFHLLVYKYF